jgi:hypothetical protein
MTHNELLARVNKLEDSYDTEGYAWGALKAVLELHKPMEEDCECNREHIPICEECVDDYPCLTIQAIDKELI